MNVTWETHDLRTAQPFGIARWTHSLYPRTFVTLQHEGRIGRGEAAPNAFYGENRATVEAVLPSLATALRDPWDWEGLQRAFASLFPYDHPSVKCALESAALEWCAVTAGVPVWRLLGLSNRPIPETSYTISIAGIPDMRRQTREAIKAGHSTLKVKLGTESDEAILTALREEAPNARVRVDANAAWSRSQAKRMLDVLNAANVEFVEQPLKAHDLEGHAELRRVSKVLIVADESLHHVEDVPRLANAFDAVNLKLAKLGGPIQTLHALRTARALGMNVMLGCMIESSLGIAAAVHLAGLADWVDLDGALLLAADPFEGLSWEAGHVARPGSPGWGVRAVTHHVHAETLP
ncbi:dipeptide epimerase [Deinococcus peraridilitoris]|uniref:Dipeptide epimerase n=1 Tax=Deinococcus peraridilitoris (strain DSM 19664 / LMG 22246 / CIP 109416 / KR-200) TaxID=937777 RepID=L0A8J2_DEIPD|nr:dipeptide epimerase [Deinococcus peraridilitoris]AFZ69400.1 enolase superfamily enzyme related to L-alanine-DL-glutamate epimerase [Deinococcus peraridilitoris DSM 19664]